MGETDRERGGMRNEQRRSFCPSADSVAFASLSFLKIRRQRSYKATSEIAEDFVSYSSWLRAANAPRNLHGSDLRALTCLLASAAGKNKRPATINNALLPSLLPPLLAMEGIGGGGRLLLPTILFEDDHGHLPAS